MRFSVIIHVTSENLEDFLTIHFSFQQLRDFSESNIRQNKKNLPQWTYNAGEEISSVQVIQVFKKIKLL